MAHRHARTTTKLRRPPADAKIKPAAAMRCPAGHEFGLDLNRFRRAHPTRTWVTCPNPACAARTPLPFVTA